MKSLDVRLHREASGSNLASFRCFFPLIPHTLFLIWGLRSCHNILHFITFSLVCSLHFLLSIYGIISRLDMKSFSLFHILMVLLHIRQCSLLIILPCLFQAQPLQRAFSCHFFQVTHSCIDELTSIKAYRKCINWLLNTGSLFPLTLSKNNMPPKFWWWCLIFLWFLDNLSAPWLSMV